MTNPYESPRSKPETDQPSDKDGASNAAASAVWPIFEIAIVVLVIVWLTKMLWPTVYSAKAIESDKVAVGILS